MVSLTTVQIELIRQHLQNACRLLQPGYAAREAFRIGLAAILLQSGRVKDGEEARSYLGGILRTTCLAYGGEAPRENSSPVCYAQVRGLRPGFEVTAIPRQPESRSQTKNAVFPANCPQEKDAFKEVLLATQNSVREMVGGLQTNCKADAALDKQIIELVNQLFGFS